jgi:nicotinate-nucleotide adenylyltransferase
MIEKIIVKDKRIKVCDFEIMNKLSGETYKTAKLLTSWYPHYEFAFIIGQDNANTIQKWVNSEYLMNQAMFIIIPREGVETDTSIKWYNQNPHISLLGMKTGIGNISSSQFKLAYKNKADTLDFVTPEVLQYIQNSRLYEL